MKKSMQIENDGPRTKRRKNLHNPHPRHGGDKKGVRRPGGAAGSLDALAVALARVSNTVLMWEHGQAFADAHGALWKAVSEVLVARTKQPGFAVVLAGAPNKRRR